MAFLNHWKFQFATTCYEKTQRNGGLVMAASKPLIQLYQDQYIHNKATFVYQTFRPSFHFITCLIQRQITPFTVRELELLIVLMQQLSIGNTVEYYETVNEVQEWKETFQHDHLFMNMKREQWHDDEALIDTFLGVDSFLRRN